MSEALEIQFASLSAAPTGTLALFAGAELALGPTARGLDERTKGAVSKAARAADFTGKAKTSMEILAPGGIDTPRLLVIGAGRPSQELDRLLLGGYALSQITARKGEAASLLAEVPDTGEAGADIFAADLAFGALLRSYAFKKYRTTRKSEDGAEDEPRDGVRRLTVHCAKPDAAAKAFAGRKAVAQGIFLARDLVNEPANMLGPVEFAERVRDLAGAGIEVEVLDEEQLRA
ncbi:MAG TPA: M17 family peptidase N-terminal domain-containing protein, partial [Hyphomicrobiaceae bacterium]|nr:M17 family peptidase N-terminal domain-containing protein [Hyphomicrobiaceae bacterium]